MWRKINKQLSLHWCFSFFNLFLGGIFSSFQVAEGSAELTIGGEKFPYPYGDIPAGAHQQEKQEEAKSEKTKKNSSDPSVPEYRIVHRGHVDLQNFTYARWLLLSILPLQSLHLLITESSQTDINIMSFTCWFLHLGDMTVYIACEHSCISGWRREKTAGKYVCVRMLLFT